MWNKISWGNHELSLYCWLYQLVVEQGRLLMVVYLFKSLSLKISKEDATSDLEEMNECGGFLEYIINYIVLKALPQGFTFS